MKTHRDELGQMSKIAAMPIDRKKPSSLRTNCLITLKFCL